MIPGAAHAWAATMLRPDHLLPWAVSVAAHAVLIVLGFFIVWTVNPPPPEERPAIVVSFDNPAPAPLSPPVADPSERSELNRSLEEVSLPSPAEAPLSELVSAALPGPAREQESAGREAIMERRLPEVRFAGLGVSNAADIVYVVDASGSMVSTLPIVIDHLNRSVSRLARTQRFQIIFYGREAYESAPHPGDVQEGVPTTRLIRATPENIRQVLAWVRTVLPGGKSNPIPALKRALWLKPDAVFLLSNVITGIGEWEAGKEALLKDIDALNPADAHTGRRRTVIKTIQFLDEDPAEILRAIGEAHGGEDGYKFIPRTEPKSP